MHIAKRLEEVFSVLEFAEKEARAGSYVAVMVSYEAAPAFDSALVAHTPSEFPLAWAAVIDDANGKAWSRSSESGGKPPFLTCNNPAVTNPAVTNPAVTNPSVTNPSVTNPSVTNPAVTNPAVTNPAVTNPAVTNPSVTNPSVTNPAVTNPAVTSYLNKSGRAACPRWSPRVDRDEYDRAVARIRDLIAAGDTYQVNYSFPLTASFSGDAYELYRELCLAQGAPYSAYLDLGRFKVLCLSPELFFERRGNHVITKPMKGTIKRGRWLEEDRELAQWLSASIKDRAENVMIVDLLRNDLGKVAVPGSVHVSSLFDLERFETVWQMTSTVEATLKDGTSLVDLMTALFPCGSVTGAPKIRTMQIIRELERFPRGAYTGAIGFLKPGGDCIFNVAIRTVVVDSETNVATFGVGGGVTIDSTAEREYEECLVKSRFLHSSAVEFQLFESLLREDGEYFLLSRHLERLRDSAEYFGFVFCEEEIRSALESVGDGKVRLTLWKGGRFEIEVEAIKPSAKRRVALAIKAVDSSDRFLFHKTTKRDFYNAQLAARPDCDDIVFWNERGEITESTIANVVVMIHGELFTPPVESGLLAGTFRKQLLAEGKIKERVITIEELRSAEELFLINSVRKWMNADLVV